MQFPEISSNSHSPAITSLTLEQEKSTKLNMPVAYGINHLVISRSPLLVKIGYSHSLEISPLLRVLRKSILAENDQYEEVTDVTQTLYGKGDQKNFTIKLVFYVNHHSNNNGYLYSLCNADRIIIDDIIVATEASITSIFESVIHKKVRRSHLKREQLIKLCQKTYWYKLFLKQHSPNLKCAPNTDTKENNESEKIPVTNPQIPFEKKITYLQFSASELSPETLSSQSKTLSFENIYKISAPATLFTPSEQMENLFHHSFPIDPLDLEL